jgi:molybdenum cofactor synthesis domain-containing protein
MSTAGLVVIGNEVLSGKVDEENARFLIRELRELGVMLMRVVFIRDDVDTIARDVREMADSYAHVFTSGGVGSTHDDVTLTAIARAFGVDLEENAELIDMLREHYGDRLNEAVLRMGRLPQGAELIGGGELRYPLVKVRNVFVFPGVPIFLRMKFEVVKKLIRGTPFVLRQVFLNVGEDRIAEPLTEIDRAFPEVEFGSYPRFDDADHRVKLTVEGRDPEQVAAGLEALMTRLDPSWVVRVI